MLLNCLDCRPGVLDKSTQGWPGKYSLCFAEDEEASPWEPLHVARGFAPGTSAVTVFAAESGHNVLSHGTGDPERLLALLRRRHGRARQPEPRALGDRVRARARRASARERDGAATARRPWLYEHAWRSLADLKRGGKVEPAFFTNPTLVDWLYRDAPGRSARSAAPADDAERVAARTRPSACIAASAPTTSCSPSAAAKPAATPPSSRRGAAAAPFPSSPRRCPHDAHPRSDARRTRPRRAPRSPARGPARRHLGLLANGKSNGMVLLDRDRASTCASATASAEVVRVAKTNASAPVSDEEAERLAKRCAAVVTAIGD